MKLSVLTRKLHAWGGLLIALPLLVVIPTGLLLMFKKQLHWVQPTEQRGTGKAPVLSFEAVLAAVRSADAGISSWGDIDRLDVRPGKGVIKVRGKNGVEVQVDAGTGAVLQVAERRSDWIEAMHDGSFFGLQWGVFVPAAVVLLGLVVTGVYLFVLPLWVRWGRVRTPPPRTAPPAS